LEHLFHTQLIFAAKRASQEWGNVSRVRPTTNVADHARNRYDEPTSDFDVEPFTLGIIEQLVFEYGPSDTL